MDSNGVNASPSSSVVAPAFGETAGPALAGAGGAFSPAQAANAVVAASAPMPIMNLRRERYTCSGVSSDGLILIISLDSSSKYTAIALKLLPCPCSTIRQLLSAESS